MKLRYLLAMLILLPACTESDAMNALTFGGGVPAAGGTACAGYSTDCADATHGTNTYLLSDGGSDHTDAQRWTASQGGTATRIRYYFTDYYDAANYKVALYNGTTLVGTGTITGSANSWVWSGNLSVEGGQSLTFAQNDVLRPCIAVDDPVTNGFQIDWKAGSGTDYWDYSETYAPASITWTSDSSYIVSIQLEYTY